MGICLSCLRPDVDDDNSRYDENSPLLNNQQNNYDKDALIKQREEELNKIVDETNEQLIDVTTFFNANSSAPELSAEIPLNSKLQDDSKLTDLQIKAKSVGAEHLTSEERSVLEDTESRLLKTIKEQTTLHKRGSLLVEFN